MNLNRTEVIEVYRCWGTNWVLDEMVAWLMSKDTIQTTHVRKYDRATGLYRNVITIKGWGIDCESHAAVARKGLKDHRKA